MIFVEDWPRLNPWGVGILCLLSGVWPLRGQVAVSDFYYAQGGSALSVSAPGVLTNDTGSGLTAVLSAGPANGTLALNADGSFLYTPTNGFTGMDGFTYAAKSGAQTSAPASVDISVLAAGQFLYDTFSRPTNNGSIFPWTRISGPMISGTWAVTNGLMVGSGSTYTYGYNYFGDTNWGDYSVQAQVRFSSTLAASVGILGRLNPSTGAHYSLWVYPERCDELNLPPLNGQPRLEFIKYENWTNYHLIGPWSVPPSVGTNWHALKMVFQGSNILSYYDGTLITNVTDNGSLDGQAAYTHGSVGLNFWISSDVYTFSADNLIVSALTLAATANNDSYALTGASGSTLRVAAPGVLANDSGNGPLTALLAAGAAHGNLILTNNGGFSYTPTNNFTGIDSFTYRCTDGQTTSSVATVTITVSNAVVANNDSYVLPANTTLNVGQPGVLSNDQGGSGSLTALLAAGAAHGNLTLTNNGGFSYTPTNNFIGIDSFTYRSTDGQTTSSVATVTLTVSNSVAASNDAYTLASNLTLNVGQPGVLSNDQGGTGSLSAVLRAGAAHGNLNFTNNGGFSYTPTNNFIGIDNFSYQATDGYNTSGVAAVTLIVTPPGGLFYDSFSRPAGSNSIFPWVNEAGVWGVTNGLMIGSSPNNSYGYAYYPNTNWTDYSVQALFRFSTTNAWGGALGGRLNPATGARYELWVYPENSPWNPQHGVPAGVAALQLIKYETWTANTTENLVRLAGMGTSWHNVELAFQGSNVFAYFDGKQMTNLVDTGSFDGQRAYTNGGISVAVYTGTTPFTLSVSNAMVNPLIVNDYYSVNENTTLTIPAPGVLTNDLDVYGTNLTVSLVGGPTNGVLTLNTNGGFSYTPSANFAGNDGFVVQAVDRSNHLGTATTVISVNPILTVTADNQSRIYGTTNPVLTVSYSGFTNGDGTGSLTGAPALGTPANPASPVGVYTIVVSQGTLEASNYGLNFVNGALTVNPAPLMILAGNTNKVYGQTVNFSGTEFSSVGLTNADSVDAVSLASSGAAATAGVAGSPYAIYATNAAGAGLTNYTISYQPGALAVSPAELMVSADDATRLYGMTNPALTVTYTGFANNENAGVLEGSPALSTTAVPGSPAGDYPITVLQGSLSNANYTFTFADGTLTVTPAPAPVITSIGLTNNVVTVSWSSVAGESYLLQESGDLSGTNWSAVSQAIPATGSTTSETNAVDGSPYQFYRVLLTPSQ